MSQPQQHHLLAAPPASRSILLGTVTILLTNQQFVDGYQNGYLRFRLSGPSIRMTDYEVYTFLLTNLRDFHYPDRWNAGYVLGWITALVERPTWTMPCKAFSGAWKLARNRAFPASNRAISSLPCATRPCT